MNRESLTELVELLITAAKERIKKEQESGISEETFRLLLSIEKLAIYL